MYDLIIIGAGPAGLTAALYASRAGLKTLVLEKGIIGGQIATTPVIENWPGTEQISGVELMEAFAKHAKKFGTEIKENHEVLGFEEDKNEKIVITRKGNFKAKAIIISTGAREKKLGVKGEDEFKGRGVSYCAVCDAPFYRDKIVAVIGGGNSALEEANYLSNFAKKVFIIHRRSSFRAEKAVEEKVRKNNKIELILDTIVEEILGENKVTGIKIKNLKTNEVKILEVDGVFIYIGMQPNSEFVKGKVELDSAGYIKINEKGETSVKGVFAAGDVTSSLVKQVITSAAEGARAAIFAEKYINGE